MVFCDEDAQFGLVREAPVVINLGLVRVLDGYIYTYIYIHIYIYIYIYLFIYTYKKGS
jgi:hypothetical protein